MNKRVLRSSVEQFGLFRFGVRSRRGASLPLVWFCLFGVICPHRGAAQETDSRNNRPVFNVRNFGARGDGRGDDRRAFAAVFRRAAKEPKAEIFVPTGVYVLRSPQDSSGPARADPASLRTYLQIPDTDLRIRGAGIDRTRILTAIEGTFLEGLTATNSILELSDLSLAYTGG